MIGRILEYDKKIQEGIISGENGNRYIYLTQMIKKMNFVHIKIKN